MVSNITFNGLVERLKEENEVKMDYLVPAGLGKMEGDTMFSFNDNAFNIKDTAHSQIATKLQIPQAFYTRMGSYEGLRSTVVNRLLPEQEKTSFVRTVGGDMRAFLSDRYKPIENLDVLNAAAPVLRDMDMQIKSSSISDKRMYLQVVFPRLEAEVKVGDAVQYGLTISNSEIGYGMVKVSPTIWRLVCSNGMVRSSDINHRHIGKQMDMGEDYSVFSDATKIADREAFMLKLRDTIQASVNELDFNIWVGKLRGATEDKVDNVVKTIKNVSKNFGISDSLEEMMVNNLATDGNFNRWGVSNAVTAIAHSTTSVDTQYEMEMIGSKIIDMPKKVWEGLVA